MNPGPTPAPARLFSPAAERNQAPIGEVLAVWLPGPAQVLEVASGSGQHAEYLCPRQPHWTWQVSDADPLVLPSLAARCHAIPGVAPPLQLDVAAWPWPVPADHYDAIFCANLLHISAPTCTVALMRGAAHHLLPGGQLILYGPFIVAGQPTAASNLAFDADLRARNPLWGLRERSAVQRAAQDHGLVLDTCREMPANNLLLRFRRLP